MKLNLTQGGKQVDIAKLFECMDVQQEGLSFSSAEHSKAMDKIAALVKVRERTPNECLARLTQAGFEDDIARHAVERAVECGLVDEQRYAAALVKGKVNQGWGRRKIMMRLEADGVSVAAIEACCDLFPNEQLEYERAMHELGKKSVRSKNPRATLVRRLIQKGYGQDLAVRAVDDFMSQAAQ